MCGIAAVFHFRDSGGADAAALDRVRDSMRARGPDGAGTWLSPDGRVGLAHRRLSIIDLSPAGAQPMHDADGTLCIVFNGEIYNYRELRAELERGGARFRSDSDTEVLLHLYRQRGPAMVRALRGMFAFALWDAGRGGMLLARDPFGIKPLYLSTSGGVLRAASQVRALLAGGGVDTAPEPAGHAGFFLWGYVPEPYTLYRGIRMLPGGTTLWVDGDGPGQPQPYTPVLDVLREAAREPARVDPGERAERLREAVAGSVRAHLVADVPVGVFLSAGIDSATLVGLASEVEGSALNTLTLAFSEYRGTERDEGPLAEAVAAHYDTRQRTRHVEAASFGGELERLLDAMDQPSVDGVNTYFVARAAVEAGLKVALSGVGGDELFGGYASFRQVPRMASLLAPLRGARAAGAVARWAVGPWIGRFTSPKYAGVLEYGATLPGAYLLRRALFMPWEIAAILGRELAREGLAELGTMASLHDTVGGLPSDRLRVSALELTWYMRNQLLRDADWAGMAHSLEIRTPLVDIDLLREVAPLLAANDPPGKRELSRTPATPLPAAVLDRPKTGFNIPVQAWLQNGGSRPNGTPRGLRGWARTVYQAAPHAVPAGGA
jgi:asparagine synthase (glutamine-hydrolysing)